MTGKYETTAFERIKLAEIENGTANTWTRTETSDEPERSYAPVRFPAPDWEAEIAEQRERERQAAADLAKRRREMENRP